MSESRPKDPFPQVERALASLSAKKDTESKGTLVMRIGPDRIIEAFTVLTQKLGVRHLTTITGLDLGGVIELDYHFWNGDRIITIKTTVPKDDPKIPTSVSIIPGAILYEMEVHDMFGVTFTNHPWMDRKLLLPDNYSSDTPPPLLKTTSPEKIRKSLGLEE